MKITAILMLFSISMQAQMNCYEERWTLDKNKLITGSLAFISGTAKGLNETLQHHYSYFREAFPHASENWFNPKISWRNKYRDGIPENGPKFPFSTTALVMFTDQYHLNHFIHKTTLLTALVIKIGEGKQPFKFYIYDLLYYTACYQAGFSLMYYPFTLNSK